MSSGFDLSPLAFAKANDYGGTPLGHEFVGWTRDQLAAELKRLKTPMEGFAPGMTAASVRAGGEQRVKKLTLIIGYMEHNALDVWTHAVPDNAFQLSIKDSLARGDRQTGAMPPALAEAAKKHQADLDGVDHAADFLQAAIADAEASARQVLVEADKAGIADKAMRQTLQGDSVRLMVRKRFGDGAGTGSLRAAVGNSTMTAAGMLAAIIGKFKRPDQAHVLQNPDRKPKQPHVSPVEAKPRA